MPLYEFRCTDCGTFEEWRTMAESSNPAHCPACAQSAQRIYSFQGLISLTEPLRLAQASSEPKWVKREIMPQEQRLKRPCSGRPWMVTH